MSTIRFLIVAALLRAVMYGEDIILPLDDGNILIHAQFIRQNPYGSYVPELGFTMTNQTSSPWRTLSLQFVISGLCNGKVREWTLPVITRSLGWAEGHEFVREYTDTVIPLVGQVDDCKTEIIKASLVLAENSKTRIDGLTGERVDLEKQFQELKTKRDAEAAEQAEEEGKASETQAAAQAKEDAAEAARQKRMAAEQRKKEADSRLAEYRAAEHRAEVKAKEEANAAFERNKSRAACSVIYQNTAEKKLKDLTVKEEQQVRSCQALDLYPPQ